MRKRTTIVLVLLGLVLLGLAGAMHSGLQNVRQQEGLTAGEPLESAPPLVVLTTVVLGGFRGLIADFLWLRASDLQDQGRYFELVQLSDWITKLEPRSTEIWGYHAWNMAYNVSVMMADPVDRWRWVRNGIGLLRDRGIVYNPGAPKLTCELGWIYQHKIGGYLDEAHGYYKQQLAADMQDLLGGPFADYDRIDADPALEARLRESYKLDPDVMRQLDSRYGPLDWRLAQTHAAYWGFRGRLVAGDEPYLPCDRMIYQSLVASFYRGRRLVAPDSLALQDAPDVRLLPKVRQAFEDAIAIHGEQTIGRVYAGFLRNAAAVLHAVGERDQAEETFAFLKQRFPSPETEMDYDEFVRHGPNVALPDGGGE